MFIYEFLRHFFVGLNFDDEIQEFLRHCNFTFYQNSKLFKNFFLAKYICHIPESVRNVWCMTNVMHILVKFDGHGGVAWRCVIKFLFCHKMRPILHPRYASICCGMSRYRHLQDCQGAKPLFNVAYVEYG